MKKKIRSVLIRCLIFFYICDLGFIVSSNDLLDVNRQRFEIRCECGNRVGAYVAPRKKGGEAECLILFVRPVQYDSTNSSQDYSKVCAIRAFRTNRPIRSIRSRRLVNFHAQNFDLDAFIDETFDDEDESNDINDRSNDNADALPSISESKVLSETANIEGPLINVYSDPVPSTSTTFVQAEENAVSTFGEAALPTFACVYTRDVFASNLNTLAAVCVDELANASNANRFELENIASTTDTIMIPVGEEQIVGAVQADRT